MIEQPEIYVLQTAFGRQIFQTVPNLCLLTKEREIRERNDSVRAET